MSEVEVKTDFKVLIGVTGASGAIYANRLLEILVKKLPRIYVVVTQTGQKVARHELSVDSLLCRAFSGTMEPEEKAVIRVFSNDDLFAPCASGTASPDAMVVVPCSMGSLARMASGVSSNLLERSADVMLKQRRKLLICPRETPLSLIHLRNMTCLVEAGAEIIPLMPGFYNKPENMGDLVDFCVGKILEQLNLKHDLYKPWNLRRM